MRSATSVRLLVLAAVAVVTACVDVPESLTRPRVGTVTLVAGANQVTQVGSEAVTPQLRVLGPDGQALSGLEVRYSTSRASASVTPAIVRTDSLGIAQPAVWTVSTVPGQDTLLAVLVGVGTYRFIATVTPPCTATASLIVGDSVNGTVSAAGCLTGGGRRATAYQVSGPVLSLPYSVLVRMTGAGYRGRVDLQANGVTLASTSFDTTTVVPNRAQFAVFLPARPYTLLAEAELPASTGSFGMQTQGSVIVSGCAGSVFIVPGGASTQSIAADACQVRDQAGSIYYGHRYRIRLSSGQRMVVRMNSITLTPFILVVDGSGTVVAQNNVGTPNSVAVEFIAPASAFYVILGVSVASPITTGGPYTISVDP